MASTNPGNPSKRELTHERIVEVASRAIRRAGYDGVGVADIMKEAGLTHGGFYAHFESRSAMLAEAVEYAARVSGASFAERVQVLQGEGQTALRAVVDTYLSDAHLAGAELGCPVAALSSEMPRQAPELLTASIGRVQSLIRTVQQALSGPDAKARAQVIASTMVGALQLARTLAADASTQPQALALLAATRKSLLSQHDAA